ncbi:MAG: hypothetical protein LBG58_12540 [Planctomycetaceae bacterium]|nr:hypothetical protein [Planctomycetaceae bacterium]
MFDCNYSVAVGNRPPGGCVGVLADLPLCAGWKWGNQINRCDLSAKSRLPDAKDRHSYFKIRLDVNIVDSYHSLVVLYVLPTYTFFT